MANELKHKTVGTDLSQTEFEDVLLHQFNSQATGDVLYASSATQLSRLGIGSTNAILTVIGGVPTWQTTLAGLTLTAPTINGTVTTTGLTLPAVTLGGTVTGGAQVLSNLGMVYIGDTSDAKVTLGLVVNQGANDDHIVSLKSSDIAHGMTTLTETDTFLYLRKEDAVAGGLQLTGLSEATIGANLQGIATTDDTTKTTAGIAPIELQSYLKSGTTAGACGANANLVAIINSGTVRFLFDAEGSGHADVEWVAFAGRDDLALVRDIEAELQAHEDAGQTVRRHILEEAGIIGKNSWHFENGKPRAMVNFTKLAMLHHGALLQSHQKIVELESRLKEAEAKLLLRRG